MTATSQHERIRARVVELCAELPDVDVEEGQHVGFTVRELDRLVLGAYLLTGRLPADRAEAARGAGQRA